MYQAWRLGGRITYDIAQFDDVRAPLQGEQDLDLAFDLLLLDGLKHLDHNTLLVGVLYALKHLRVFATTNLAYDLKLILVAAS
jgi:hypothetical protein